MAIVLKIPYENGAARDLAKKSGGRWQPQAKAWVLSGDCPAALDQFRVEVSEQTYTLESLIEARLDKPLYLLKAVYSEADLEMGDRKPHHAILDLVGNSPLTPGTTVPPAADVQRLARKLAAKLLWETGQVDLARSIDH